MFYGHLSLTSAWLFHSVHDVKGAEGFKQSIKGACGCQSCQSYKCAINFCTKWREIILGGCKYLILTLPGLFHNWLKLKLKWEHGFLGLARADLRVSASYGNHGYLHTREKIGRSFCKKCWSAIIKITFLWSIIGWLM